MVATLIDDEAIAGTAPGFGFGQKIIRRANGDLWTVLEQYNNTNPTLRFYYSKNNGAAWTAVPAMDISTATQEGTSQPAWFIDVDGYVHLVFQRRFNVNPTGIIYRRGTFAADGNSIAWSTDVVASTADYASQWGGYKEIVAHRDPRNNGGWFVHLIFSGSRSTYYGTVFYQRIAISSTGIMQVAYTNTAPLKVFEVGGASPYGATALGSIDFEHTGDGLTVKNGQPNLWIAGTSSVNLTLASQKRDYVVKLTYDGAGGWTAGSQVALGTAQVENCGSMWGRWDGTRFVIAGQEKEGTNYVVRVYDVNSAGTSATKTDITSSSVAYAAGVGGVNGPSTNNAGEDAPSITNTFVSMLPSGDIIFVGSDSAPAITTKLQYRRWTRSLGSLAAPVVMTGASSTYVLAGPLALSRDGAYLDVVVQEATAWGGGGPGGPTAPIYDYYAGTFSFAPNAPTVVTPGNGATVNTDVPTLGVTFSVGVSQKGHWQLATDAGFTTNVRDLIEADSDLVNGPATNTEVLPTGSKINQGTWYLRARSEGAGGIMPSAWSTTNTITVSHPPSASGLSPTGGQYVAFGVGNISFNWNFQSTSPPSTQTAYQIIVERNSDGLVLADTGKTAGTAGTANVNLAAGYKDTDLRWKIRLWDNDDVVGSYSTYQIFRMGDAPTIVVTDPAEGSTVAVNNPTAQWTFADLGGRTQANYRVIYQRTSDGVVLHDSGTISGSVTSYVPPGFVVDNDTDHIVTVIVTDTGGIQASDSNIFTTSWIPPAQPIFTVDESNFASLGYVDIQWDDSLKDPGWYSWRIYRKLHVSGTWELVDELFTDAPVNHYHDYLPGANLQQDWAVVQVVVRFGSQVESNRAPVTKTPIDDHYWLVRANNVDGVNLRFAHATSDSFSDQFEQEEVHLIGRGRHFEYGDRLGYSGSLVGELRDTTTLTARAQRLMLDEMKAARTAIWIRTPFGDVWHVSPSDLSYQRVPGVGTSEFVDVTVPYSEVSD